MKGNFQVRFLGGLGRATAQVYPVPNCVTFAPASAKLALAQSLARVLRDKLSACNHSANPARGVAESEVFRPGSRCLRRFNTRFPTRARKFSCRGLGGSWSGVNAARQSRERAGVRAGSVRQIQSRSARRARSKAVTTSDSVTALQAAGATNGAPADPPGLGVSILRSSATAEDGRRRTPRSRRFGKRARADSAQYRR